MNSYEATTWEIKFKLATVQENGKYYLRLALASAHQANLQVRIYKEKYAPFSSFLSTYNYLINIEKYSCILFTEKLNIP